MDGAAIFDLPHEADFLILIFNVKETHSIFSKLLDNLFLSVPTVRAL